MGFLIDFLSHAAIVGFMGGAAITIALQQLKGFLGIKKFTKKTDIISVMNSVFSSAQNGVSYIYLSNSFITVLFLCLCLWLSVFYIGSETCIIKILIHIFHKFAVELADNSHWSFIFDIFDSL